MTKRTKDNLTALAVALMVAATIVVWLTTIDVNTESSEPAQLIVTPSLDCSFTWVEDGDLLGSGCEVRR